MLLPPPALARLALRLPPPLLLGSPLVRDGQTLDRRLQWLLLLDRALRVPPLTEGTPAQARRNFRRTAPLLAPTAAVATAGGSLPGPARPLPTRRYAPPGPGSRGPALLFFHGGGWVTGDLDSHDGVCRALAARAGCQVIAVDYRLAPEAPYPAAVEDAWAALRATLDQAEALGVDPARLAIGGDSAGGNLSAVVSLRARDAGLAAPCLQLLVYPGCDNSRNYPSADLFADGFLLTRADLSWFRGHYLPDLARRSEPEASPLLAPDLRGVAPACLLIAGFDPLRDEGNAYARRLAEAGVRTEHVCFPELVHGFLNLAGAIPAADRAFDRAVAALRAAFAA